MICKKHGAIEDKDIYYWEEQGYERKRCRLCMKERNEKSYLKRKKKILKQAKIKYENNKEIILKKRRETSKKRKIKIFTHYSNGKPKCAKCGNTKTHQLCIDHIENNGSEHRKKEKITGGHIYLWIIKNNFPIGFQVLCHNCNTKKQIASIKSTSKSAMYRKELKIDAIKAYSVKMKCDLCKENDIDLLTIDHANGNGNEHRKKENITSNFYYWLKKNKYPSGFRILCWNHNLGAKCL